MSKDSTKPPLVHRLFEGVDIAPLAFFRLVCGFFMAYQAWHFLANDGEEIKFMYLIPKFNFTYFGLGWLEPLPGAGMFILYWILMGAGIGIALGFLYRLCCVVYFVGFGYAFFSDIMLYQNHYYLLVLLAFVLTFVPAHRALSVDALFRPALRTATVPMWGLFLCRFQLSIVYIYGAFAKLNADWLRGEPMRSWMADEERQQVLPWIGQWFTEEWLVYFFSYSGLLLDLLVVPGILWRRTRWLALGSITLFHLMNSQLWIIGIFPWFMILATLILLPPRYFRLGTVVPTDPAPRTLTDRQRKILALIVVYALLHLLVPFRHLLYPGEASWTEEGMYFAWRMKLRTKSAGHPLVVVTDSATRKSEILDPRQPRPYLETMKEFLVRPAKELRPLLEERIRDQIQEKVPEEALAEMTEEQLEQTVLAAIERRRDVVTTWRLNYLAIKPEAILQFAHLIADEYRRRGFTEPQVRMTIPCTLNARNPQLLVDPSVDLAQETSGFGHFRWIQPLTEKLRPGQRPSLDGTPGQDSTEQ